MKISNFGMRCMNFTLIVMKEKLAAVEANMLKDKATLSLFSYYSHQVEALVHKVKLVHSSRARGLMLCNKNKIKKLLHPAS